MLCREIFKPKCNDLQYDCLFSFFLLVFRSPKKNQLWKKKSWKLFNCFSFTHFFRSYYNLYFFSYSSAAVKEKCKNGVEQIKKWEKFSIKLWLFPCLFFVLSHKSLVSPNQIVVFNTSTFWWGFHPPWDKRRSEKWVLRQKNVHFLFTIFPGRVKWLLNGADMQW